jgi:chromosome segregation protein
MGEQSAKHLRGRAMDDVIFAGSETRGPAGLAEVSLTFDTLAMPSEAAPGGVPWGAAGPSEVVVTRRLYRGGESEYLLGGVPCRLRDIVEFFLGTGVGSKAYAIIEQGRIGFIVSSRPEERRSLIDEAAGITKYKAKKKIAERRMEATRQHLLRVSDIIAEIETRLRSLKLQAQKAERYKRYKAECRDLELWASSQKYLGLLAEQKHVGAEYLRVEERHTSETSALLCEESAVEAERLALGEEMAELAATREELLAIENKASLLAQRSEYYSDEASGLAQRAERALKEIDGITARMGENLRILTEQQELVGRHDDEAAERARELEEREQAYAAARAELLSSRQQLEQANAAAAAAAARIARLESESEAARLRGDDLDRRLADVAAEDGNAALQIEQLLGECASVDDALAEIRGRAAQLADQRAQAEARAAALRDEVARGELELETLREEAHRRRSRLHSLAEIQARYESFQRGVRAIMQRARTATDAGGDCNGPSGGVRGVVADIVQPPPELETALEAVLGERLGNIIVESHDVGVEAIEYLKSKSEGRSSFIPLGLRGAGALSSAPVGTVVYDAAGVQVESAPAPVVFPMGDGVRGPMLELIGYDRQYDGVADFLLGDVIVVENLKRALDLWRETRTDKTLVTLDGEVIDPHGVVTGGSREAALAGVLSQKREIRELEQVVTRLEGDTQTALDRHVSNKQALAEVGIRLQGLSDEIRRDELDLLARQKDGDRLLRERTQLETRRAQLAAAAEELRLSAAQNRTRLDEALAALVELRQAGDGHEASAASLRVEVLAREEGVETLNAALSGSRIAAAAADERRRSTRETLERLTRENAEHESRRASLEHEAAADTERAQNLRREAEQMRQEASLLQAESGERASAHAERQVAVEERNGHLARREAELRAARASVAELAQSLSALELRRQEIALRLGALDEHVCERYADVACLSAVLSEYHLRALFGTDEENRLKELRGLIERMGDINLAAIQESDELQKRYDFLTTQKADLESAISRLESAIEKINRASRKRFREVFDAVNAKFQEVFPHLFGGGRAYLALSDENNLLETGVEIVANPPGKKIMQNIELLSGGEKALTAVSLLFAIFLVKPSPFCVLDEVDAPLDDVNVGRFNQAVREMTDRSQFIIVTHNQNTMEIADRLCGVTMEEPGVSKLVAVNLRGARRPPAAAAASASPAAPDSGDHEAQPASA